MEGLELEPGPEINDLWKFVKENTPSINFYIDTKDMPSKAIKSHNLNFLNGDDIDFTKIKFERVYHSSVYSGIDEIATTRFLTGIMDINVGVEGLKDNIVTKGVFCVYLEYFKNREDDVPDKWYELKGEGRFNIDLTPNILITEDDEVIMLPSGSSTKGVK